MLNRPKVQYEEDYGRMPLVEAAGAGSGPLLWVLDARVRLTRAASEVLVVRPLGEALGS